ncbi:winged helix-turn-helix domain-containing protein [Myceligenerans cantabricum]
MLRIHFTAEDLGRVLLAPGPDPLWETRLSAHLINDPHGARGFIGWRTRVVERLPRQTLPYLHLVAPDGSSPDFLTPETGCTDFESGVLDVVLTGQDRLAAELGRLTVRKHATAWVGRLAAGSPQALQGLRSSMTAYYRHAVAPVWAGVRTVVERERATQSQALAGRGVETALSALHVTTSWSDRTLTVDDGTADRDLHLDGRGLRLVPSYFCRPAPVTFADPRLVPTLVFPAARTGQLTRGTTHPDGSLTALLGRTRSMALQVIAATAMTTTSLARRLEISPASASQHAAVLRDAGLITSRRDGRWVVHMPTTLGARLLDGRAARPAGTARTGRPARAGQPT